VNDAERKFQDDLRELLELADPADENGVEARYVVGTFEDHGVLTRNAGLVIRLSGGAEFQLTIVQVERGTIPE
jgi:hypothetical protein